MLTSSCVTFWIISTERCRGATTGRPVPPCPRTEPNTPPRANAACMITYIHHLYPQSTFVWTNRSSFPKLTPLDEQATFQTQTRRHNILIWKKSTTCLQWTTQMVRGKCLIRGRSISAGYPSFHIFPASLASAWAAVIKITLYTTQREDFFLHRHGCSHICLLLEPEPPCCVGIISCRQVRKPSAKSCEGDLSGFAGVIEKEVQCCGVLSGLCWTKWQVNPAVNRWD